MIPLPPKRSKFGIVVSVLLLVIVFGALGGWYFWGVNLVVVVSPPDARVFFDGQELYPQEGRYVIPHASRKSHLLKVKHPGYADTIERVDFPLTSFNEWANVTMVRSSWR